MDGGPFPGSGLKEKPRFLAKPAGNTLSEKSIDSRRKEKRTCRVALRNAIQDRHRKTQGVSKNESDLYLDDFP